MKIVSRALTALFLGGVAAAQNAPAPTAALNLTVNYPSASVVSTMFGTLPKDVELIEVTACNDTPSAAVLSNGRVVQALRKNGIQALSRDAAISTMQTAENRTWQNILLRNSTHAMNIVNFLVISKSVSLGPVLSNALPSAQVLLDAIIPEFAKDVPVNQYLNFDRDALPDKTQLSPLDCATGLMFTLRPSGPARVSELTLEVPTAVPAPASGAHPAAAAGAPDVPPAR
jgi:hypothetical protein